MPKITLNPNTRKGDVQMTGDVVTIDLDPVKLFQPVAGPIEAMVQQAIANPSRQPRPTTVKRRGPGKLHNVTGRLRSGIEVIVRRVGRHAGKLDVLAPSSHFKHWFPKARLFQTTWLGEAQTLMNKVRPHLAKGLRNMFGKRRK